MVREKSMDTLYWDPLPLLQGELTLGGIPEFTWFSTGPLRSCFLGVGE